MSHQDFLNTKAGQLNRHLGSKFEEQALEASAQTKPMEGEVEDNLQDQDLSEEAPELTAELAGGVALANTGETALEEGELDAAIQAQEDPQRDRGLYSKYIVNRTDGSSFPGGKHHGCEYFVLDLTHDKFAIEALEAYETACADKYPKLAEDLRLKIAQMRLTL